MEDLSKFLPLYLGHKFRYRYVDWEKDSWSPWTILNGRDIDKIQDLSIDKIQLQLRPLSSITEEEGKALDCMGWETRWDKNGVPHTLFQPEAFIRLIEWGFDIFGLRDKGLALYQEDIKE